MKQLLILVIGVLVFSQVEGQRYFTPVFDNVVTTENINYGQADDYLGATQQLLLDFYEPEGDTETERPLIVYIHGGGFTSGSKDLETITLICEAFAKRGYAVASPDYRLDPTFDIYNSETDRRAMIDAMHDARAAIRFFRANASTYKIDVDQVIIGGESAGAATSMLVNYVDEQSELDSTYPMASPNNIEGESGNPGYDSKAQLTMCLCGLMLDANSMQVEDAPYLWIHGTEDSFVPFWLADLINTRADEIGLEHTRIVQEGADHCPWYYLSNPDWEIYLDSTVQYMVDFIYPQLELSVSETIREVEWTIYPNPANEKVVISNIRERYNYELMAASGKVVARGIVGPSLSEINVSQLVNGSYVLRVGGASRQLKVLR